MSPRANPAWTNKALFEHWSELESLVGERAMPVLDARTKKRLAAREFGSGAYGTVMPTGTEGLVCKVTSDATEAQFVASALALARAGKHWPPGMIRYRAIAQLRGEHRRRPIFALWRDEAEQVGESFRRARYGGSKRTEAERQQAAFNDRVYQFKTYAAAARDVLLRAKDPARALAESLRAAERWRGDVSPAEEDGTSATKNATERQAAMYTGAERAGHCLALCLDVAQMMGSEPLGYRVGEALEHYLGEGILLADVHAGNVGYTEDGLAVITDPGHAVFLDARHLAAKVPTLSGDAVSLAKVAA